MNNSFSVTIRQTVVLDSLPSGSGLIWEGGNAYVVGDDATSLLKISDDLQQIHRIHITGQPDTVFKISKAIKPDYESAVSGEIDGQSSLFAFGSGSLPAREQLLQVSLANGQNQHVASLSTLYAAIRTELHLPDSTMNIEGAARCKGWLYLFLRKENIAVRMLWTDFVQYLDSGAIPQFKHQVIRLPTYNGISAGFSGAAEVAQDGNQLLFCASLENTANAIDDGEITGSYIGVLRMQDNGELILEATTLLKDTAGNIVKEKIESIAITGKKENGDITAMLVADNDGATTTLFKIHISTSQ
ncbi:MAG: hypothetical protein V4649_08460 [Bacteroidota bacterium]